MSCKGTHLELDVNVLQRDTPKTYVQHTGFGQVEVAKMNVLQRDKPKTCVQQAG